MFLCLDFHGQGNAFFRYVYGKNLYFHNISHAHCFEGVFDKAVSDLRDMYQSVLVDANVYKDTEINYIADSPLEDHTGF